MARLYAVTFDRVSISAAQDLINITATASMACRVRRLELGQATTGTWASLPFRIVRNPATVTAGSGGSAATPAPLRDTDSAATFTARINDTTAQTTSGTAAILFARDWELLNGSVIVFTPVEEVVIKPSEGLAINSPTAPGSAITASGTLIVEELI
ncbi:MAG: hypothetical protein ACRED8_09440 [Caulobacteraceae bacterium]